MATSLFNRFGNPGWQQNYQPQRNSTNILHQLAMLKNNPGAILDILLQNGKINQQQYSELQQYKNNPQAIGNYLISHGKQNEIYQAEQDAKSIR